jgi:hypothetical protein
MKGMVRTFCKAQRTLTKSDSPAEPPVNRLIDWITHNGRTPSLAPCQIGALLQKWNNWLVHESDRKKCRQRLPTLSELSGRKSASNGDRLLRKQDF